MKKVLCLMMLAGLATALYLSKGGAEAAEREREYRGEVVYIGDDFLEFKRGGREFKAYYGDSTRYYDQSGAEVGLSGVDLCQLVRVRYVVRDRKNMIVSLHIQRPGQCRK